VPLPQHALDAGSWTQMAADFLIRLFMIQRDCGHGAFFLRRGTNH
jgi:acyl-lipid omega-6 desaturase (Delta-12 desaturase)